MLTTRRKLEAALLTLVSVSVAVRHVSCLEPRDTVVGVIALMVKRLTVVSPAYSSLHLLPMRSLKGTSRKGSTLAGFRCHIVWRSAVVEL
jgi:hypothetical protein